MKFDITHALRKLYPEGAKFVQEGIEYSGLKWIDERPKPTETELNAKVAELQAEYDAQSYARSRSSQYPSITDVVVALAEKEEGDDTMWKEITALRAKVKSDNPKPS